MLERFKIHIASTFPEIMVGKVYLAISGGIDSCVLLDLLVKLGVKPTLLHCNFQLRGKESEEDEAFVRELADQQNLAFKVRTFDTKQEAEMQHLTIQETARNLRYQWFEEIIQEDGVLLTAHHLNDRIETFQINLLRGTGIKGLAAIPARRGYILRPLLLFDKKEIVDYAEENELRWREDSSNQSNKYLRNRIRHELVPLMTELDEQYIVKMQHLFSELEKANALIDKLTRNWRTNNYINRSFLIQSFKELDELLQEKVFNEEGIYRKNLDEFLHFMAGNKGGLFLTKEFAFTHDRKTVFVQEKLKAEQINQEFGASGFELKREGQSLSIQLNTNPILKIKKGLQQLDASKLKAPIKVRNWKIGDRIHLLGLNGSKLVSKILTEAHLNSFDKEDVLVLESSDGKLACVIGHCVSEEFKLTQATEKSWDIIINSK